MLFVGTVHISVVYLTYFLAGLGLLFSIQKFDMADPITMLVGLVVIAMGLIEIKDFFWYGQGLTLSIPVRYTLIIKKWARKGTVPAVILLGFLVAAVELPCTGGPYLAITALLAKDFNILALYYLLIYNLIFVMPLIAIMVLSYLGTNVKNMKKWKMKYRKYMRLTAGITLILLGVLLILYSRGIISL